MAYIDIIPGIEFSEVQASALAAVIGAILSFGLAFGSTMYFSKRSRDNERNDQEVERRRATYLRNVDAINDAIYEINHVHHIAMRNKYILEDYKNGIYNEVNDSLIHYLNLPKPYVFNHAAGNDIYNEEVMSHWRNLVTESELQNIIIDEFNDYYGKMKDEIHKLRLGNQEVSLKIIKEDNKGVLDQAKGSIGATDVFIEKIIRLKSLINVFAKSLTENTREITEAKVFRQLLDDMMAREADGDQTKKEIARIRKEFEKKSAKSQKSITNPEPRKV